MLKALKKRKLRSAFAVLGVALGIGAMIALNAITQGTIHQYEQIAAKFRGDIMVQRSGMPDPVLSQVDPSFVQELQKLPQVSKAYPVAFYAIKILKDPKGAKAGTRFFVITGVPAESQLLYRHTLISGQYFKDKSNQILLGQLSAADLGLKENDTLMVDNRSFTIVGIYRTGIRILDKGALLSTGDIEVLRHTKNSNLIVLDLKQRDRDIPQVINEISTKFPDLEGLKSSEVLDNFDQVRLFKNVCFGISLVAVIISTIGILNAMIMSVFERTREIGILRSLGWSSKMILGMILSEGIIISCLGGLFGILGGYLVTEILVSTIDIGLIEAYYPVQNLLIALATSVVVGILGSLLPALKAMRITPLEALRYE